MTRNPPQAAIDRAKYPGSNWRAYRVTPHFRLGEFFNADATQPPASTMRMVRHFARTILEPLRERYGACIVVSGYRTPERNRAVGGARWSWHVWEWHPGEMAADVVFRGGTPAQWGEEAAKGPAGGIGIYAGHLHVDNRPGRVTWVSQAE